MVTQEMKDKGIHCKGQGFNCYNCNDKKDCIEYVNTEVKEKPPLGIEPRWIWEEKRLEELKCAIDRYMKANLPVPNEWIEEYNALIKRCKES